MKKYLYILRNRSSSSLIYEDGKLKYFEGDGEIFRKNRKVLER